MSHTVDAHAAIKLGEAYHELGDAVREQLDDLLADPLDAEVNRGAVDMINRYGRRIARYAPEAAREVLDAVDAWYAERGIETGQPARL